VINTRDKNTRFKSLEDKLHDLHLKSEKLLEEKNQYIDDSLKRRNYIKELEQISHEIMMIKYEIFTIKGPIVSNQDIDIYLDVELSTKEEKNYFIAIHNTLDKIGYVRVTLENVTSYLGNIGYRLDKKFRGNGYMLQALNLLKPTMIEEGLTKPKITVYPNNISSVKTIEKFGGKLIPKENDIVGWDTYEVNLSEEEKIK